MVGHWLWWHMGLAGTGPWYAFYSGFGSNMLRIALIGSFWRMLNCHEAGCYRIGHHYRGTIVCHHHRGNLPAILQALENPPDRPVGQLGRPE